MEYNERERSGERPPHREAAPRRRRRKRHIFRKVLFCLFTLCLVGVLTAGMVAWLFMQYVNTTLRPSLALDTIDYTMDESSIIYYQDKATGEWVELQTLHGLENRILKKFSDFPDELWQAAVAIEDHRFFQHNGVDWMRTAKAAVNVFTHASNTFGGSTITQQVLKNLTGEKEGTIKRKIKEIFRALEFEKTTSKNMILELYLNEVFFGMNCYGVQTAAQYYFGKDVEDLSLAECASIIAITNNPSIYGPLYKTVFTRKDGSTVTCREKNKERQEIILDAMADPEKGGYITKEEAEAAKREELHFIERTTTADKALAEVVNDGKTSSGAQSWFIDQVRADVAEDLAELTGTTKKLADYRLLHGGYKIYTTIDPDIQHIVEDVYENNYLDVTSGTGQELKSAITIVDVTNGNVVAMVGDMRAKKGDNLFNYATDPSQQCGSSIKPLSCYAPALDANAVTPATTFDNYPVRLLNGSPWPKNSPNKYTGWTTLAYGVAQSVNTVAVQTVERLGIPNSYQFMTENLGFTTLVSPEENASRNDMNTSALGLGGLTQGVTTEEMAAAYASFANNGVYNSPRLYVRVTDNAGNVILDNETETHVAMKETTAYFMNKLLQGVVSSGTGTMARLNNMTVAGKTGTTSTNYDRYFVGYTPYYSAAVWTGYRNNERIVYKPAAGDSSNPALTMWKRVMSRVHEGLENKSFPKPSSGVSSIQICADSGLRPGEGCSLDARGSRVISVEVATGTGPTEECTMHKTVNYCTEGKCIATPYCPAESVKPTAFLDYVREDYGPNIVAEDNAYLLKNVEAVGVQDTGTPEPEGETGSIIATPGLVLRVCPVHSNAPVPVDPVTEPVDPGIVYDPETGLPILPVDPNPVEPSGGEPSGNEPSGNEPTDPGGTNPPPATEPSDDWWSQLWGGGTTTPVVPDEPGGGTGGTPAA